MSTGRVFLVRVDHNTDLIQYLSDFAKMQKINAAAFTAVGAFKSAKLGFYDQKTCLYIEHEYEEPLEIASLAGNVSLKDSQPFVHAHAVLTNAVGKAMGGHLVKGRVFAAEVHLFELLGPKIERRFDAVTGLSLWNTSA